MNRGRAAQHDFLIWERIHTFTLLLISISQAAEEHLVTQHFSQEPTFPRTSTTQVSGRRLWRHYLCHLRKALPQELFLQASKVADDHDGSRHSNNSTI